MMAANEQRLLGRLGERVVRLEDPPLLTGNGRFAADIDFPHQLHMRVVRSPYAHATITAIDTAVAKAAPGVVAVWTADDITDIPPIDFREGHVEALAPYRQYVLAREIVRYVGEPVAVVFAEDAYLAEDAAELVTVAADALPVVMSTDDEPGEFAPGVSTEAAIVEQAYGDLDAAFAAAHAIVSVDVRVGRHSGVPLEGRGAIARFDAARDVLELHGAAKVPHRNREALAAMFGRSLAAVHVYEAHVGGGFGVRGELYPEDVLVCAAALRLGRPVKWIEDRQEHLMAANQSRQQRHIIRAAVSAEGDVLALDDELYLDQGAYVRTHGTRVANMTTGTLPGLYRIPAFRAACHVRLTNKTPAATYRSPGRYESTFVRERLMDAIAAELGMDPVELRRRNLIAQEEMPYARDLDVLGDKVEHDTGDYEGLLDKALEKIGWEELQETLTVRRAAGELVGAGISMFFEKSGLGPADAARIMVDATGAVEVITGGASVGQGFETAMAQICAAALGTDYRRIRVVHGQTDRIDHGVGAHASRATVLTGSAVNATALKVRKMALEMAAELLQTPADALDIVDGTVLVPGNPAGPTVTLGEVAKALAPNSPTRGDRDPYLSAEEWFHTDHQTYPYGIHMAVVAIDGGTGMARIERYFMAYDIGRAVNPMLVEGQLMGGFAQGLGGALMEEFVFDAGGEPLSVTYVDYLVPTLHDVPVPEILLTEDAPSARNPLGIKGAGEAGVTGAAAAIASAIDAAIGVPGAVTRLPVTPQRLKKILDDSRAGRHGHPVR
jgi:carbon-monoxide dehydrogenase large subunit/6-hydroxypseudooxynicotine dehydrogenase subunit gamma